MKGYLVLGGTNIPPELPFLKPVVARGNHTGSKFRGQFVLCTTAPSKVLHIPSRDKIVSVWSDGDLESFAQHVGTLDSQSGVNYRSKLASMVEALGPGFTGLINNEGTTNHGSLAIISGADLFYYGLHDTFSDVSYIMWGTPKDLDTIRYSYPLRYLVYRFPSMPIVFLPGEAIGSKWWRWTRANSLFQAFNALEMRLANGRIS